MSLKVQRAREWLARKSRNPRNAYPMATVVYYGPTDRLASKVVAAVVRGDTDKSAPLERWFVDAGDIRQDSAVLLDLVTWLKRYAVQQVFVTPRIAGCPHEEGIDYAEGQPCPACPFWANRVRFIDELAPEDADDLGVPDPEAISLLYSEHCQHYVHEGKTLDVQIYRGPQEGWALEVVNEAGTSTVWDDRFDSDGAAWAEFLRTLQDEGIEAFGDG